MEEGIVLDGIIAQDSTQIANIWRLRENIAEALKRAGAVYKYDVSIPVPDLYDLVTEMRTRMPDEVDVLGMTQTWILTLTLNTHPDINLTTFSHHDPNPKPSL